MSTRALIIFKDENGAVSVYRHSDGYPDTQHGVIAGLQKVIDGGRVWPLPRFEAAEFAAGFIATLKTGEGDYRVVPPGDSYGVAYTYEVTCPGANYDGSPAPLVVCWCGEGKTGRAQLFRGTK